MMNREGGPWAFWIEVKGPETAINPDQKVMSQRMWAAEVPCFIARSPDDLNTILRTVGFPPLNIEFTGDFSRESDVQKAIKGALKAKKFWIIDTSQGFRPGGKRHGTTRITKGTPDLYVWRKAL
jgi:hypothetical protein